MILEQDPSPLDNYTMVTNDFARDPSISPKAKSLYLFMRSHRAGWRVTVDNLAHACGMGRSAARLGVQELIEAGYVTRSDEQVKRADGSFDGYIYRVRTTPCVENRTKADSVIDSQTPETVTRETVNNGFRPPKEDYSYKKTNNQKKTNPPTPHGGDDADLPPLPDEPPPDEPEHLPNFALVPAIVETAARPKRKLPDKRRERMRYLASTARTQEADTVVRGFVEWRGAPLDKTTYSEVAATVTGLLGDGIPAEQIRAGLAAWQSSDSWSTKQIRVFVNKAITTPATSANDDKVAGWLTIGTDQGRQQLQ